MPDPARESLAERYLRKSGTVMAPLGENEMEIVSPGPGGATIRRGNHVVTVLTDPIDIVGDPNGSEHTEVPYASSWEGRGPTLAPTDDVSVIREAVRPAIPTEIERMAAERAANERAAARSARAAAEGERERATFGAHAINQLAGGLGSNAAAIVPAIRESLETGHPFLTSDSPTIRSEIAGEPEVGTFRRNQREIARDLDIMAAENPRSAGAGQLAGGLAQAVIVPVPPVAKGASIAARLARTGGTAAALGAVSGLGNSDEEGLAALPDAARAAAISGTIGTVLPAAQARATRLGRIGATTGAGALSGGLIENERSSAEPWSGGRALDVGLGVLGGGALGLTGSTVAELNALRRLDPESLVGFADDLDAAAAPYRTRSAGARTVAFQRLADDLPGSHLQTARTLNDTGIARRGEMFLTQGEAGERAAAVRARSGARIGETRRAMAELTPPSAQGLPELHDAVLPSLDDVYVPPGRARGMVDHEPIAQAFDDIASEYANVMGGEHIVDAARAEAAARRAAGPMTYADAQRSKALMDELTNWHDPAPGRRLPAMQSQKRQIRGVLRGEMDRAVGEDMGEEFLAGERAARNEYQVSELFDRMAHDSNLRETANRVFSPSDYATGIAGAIAEHGGGLTGTALMLANRALRGTEASMAAGSLERLADAMRRRAAGSAASAATAADAAPSLLDRLIARRPLAGSLAAPEGVSGLLHPSAPAMSTAAAQDVSVEDDDAPYVPRRGASSSTRAEATNPDDEDAPYVPRRR